jgi:hypothetical protein
MMIRVFSLVLFVSCALGHVAGCQPSSDFVDCSFLSEEDQKRTASYLAGVAYTGPCPPIVSTAAISAEHDAGTAPDACAACVRVDCAAEVTACFADSDPCSGSDPAYGTLTSCASAHCAFLCPEAP